MTKVMTGNKVLVAENYMLGDNMKTRVKEIGYGLLDWIRLARNRNTIMNLRLYSQSGDL
jgi:hypothetical protein